MNRRCRWYRRIVQVLTVTTLLAVLVAPVAANARYASPVAPFLVKSGEVRGFDLGRPQVFRTVSAVRDAAGGRPTRSEIRRYETEGFIEAAIVRLHDRAERAAKGVSSVFEFETPTGAKAEMKAKLEEEFDPAALRSKEFSRYFTSRRFTVPGVPGAAAFAYVTNRAAAKVGVESGTAGGLIVEGNCLLSVGIFRPGSKEVSELVISGLQAISGRTPGSCP